MGGWRCTFRNCSAVADGKTHVFHYPVFDKARCLKWLANAGRLEFLNLKLSQLKNRVICQLHFKDECFMNYRKDKLTFVAVPTENGSLNNSMVTIDEKSIPIAFEDIENSESRPLTPREKKANLSIIYANFLTDPIVYSADNIPETVCDANSQEIKANNFINFKMLSNKTYLSKTPQESSEITTLPASQPLCNSENIEKGISFQIDICPTQDLLNLLETTPNLVDTSTKGLPENFVINLNDNTDALINNLNVTAEPENETVGKKNNHKIKIISEKKLTVPFPVASTFKPVCPMGILNPRKRKVETDVRNKEINFTSIVKDKPLLQELKPSRDPLPMKPNLLESKGNSITISSPKKTQNANTVSSCTKSPSIKNKVPPERIAAIEEKRIFNKKLRDMIEFCLDDKEENTKTLVNTKPTISLQAEKEVKKSPQIKNKSLVKQPEKCTTKLTSENVKNLFEDKREQESTINEKGFNRSSKSDVDLPDYKLSVLEARLSRMESLLLKKVGENTQRIVSLKQTLSKSDNVKKRSIKTQTMQDTETHKKLLFHEISRYLSPDLNSLIYEELFIKEFENSSTNKVGISPIKRQRR